MDAALFRLFSVAICMLRRQISGIARVHSLTLRENNRHALTAYSRHQVGVETRAAPQPHKARRCRWPCPIY